MMSTLSYFACTHCGKELAVTTLGVDGFCSRECREAHIKERGCQLCGKPYFEDEESNWDEGTFNSYSDTILHCPDCVDFYPIYLDYIQQIEIRIEECQEKIEELRLEFFSSLGFEFEIDEINRQIFFKPSEEKIYSSIELRRVIEVIENFNWSEFYLKYKNPMNQLENQLNELFDQKISYADFLKRGDFFVTE